MVESLLDIGDKIVVGIDAGSNTLGAGATFYPPQVKSLIEGFLQNREGPNPTFYPSQETVYDAFQQASAFSFTVEDYHEALYGKDHIPQVCLFLDCFAAIDGASLSRCTLIRMKFRHSRW